jgi:hypothetical protein
VPVGGIVLGAPVMPLAPAVPVAPLVPGAIEVFGTALGAFMVAPPVAFPAVPLLVVPLPVVPGAGLVVEPPELWPFIALESVVLPLVVLPAPVVASGDVEPEVVLPAPPPVGGGGSMTALAVLSVAVVPASGLLPRNAYHSAPATARITIAANSQVFPPDFSPSKRGTGILLTI